MYLPVDDGGEDLNVPNLIVGGLRTPESDLGITGYLLFRLCIRVRDGVVRGKTYVLLTRFHEETSELELRYSGVYDDEFVRTDEGWKFKRRFS